jgi:hypothetical protein
MRGMPVDAARNVVVTPQDEQALVRELAEAVVGIAAPDELALFDATAQEYFANPKRVLETHGRDEPVGFGLDIAMLTPYALAVVGPVVSFLVSVVADSVKDELKPRVGAMVRALFRGEAADSAEDVQPLTPEQARQVRAITRARALELGLEESTATVLADAVVGGILLSG